MPSPVLGFVALAVGVLALVIAVALTRRVGRRDSSAVPQFWRRVLFIGDDSSHRGSDEGAPERPGEQIAFVVNPTKTGADTLRDQAFRACAARGLPEPMWFETTLEDSGTGVTLTALAQGADVVVAAGGDGTVRGVAEAVVGRRATMGIIPLGTGNLFARNLDIPLNDPAAALRTALDGAEADSDVGWIDVRRAHPGHGEDGEHIFLVIAGAGLDAEMVAGADDEMKRRLGWFAYFVAAAAHMRSKRMTATVTVDDREPVHSQMRTVLMANVGKLPGGIQLVPDASAGDGVLDVATLDARGGIVGWTELFGTVVAQGAGVKDTSALRLLRASRIDHVKGKRVRIEMASPQKVQADGETLGRARTIIARVDHGALIVRVPDSFSHD